MKEMSRARGAACTRLCSPRRRPAAPLSGDSPRCILRGGFRDSSKSSIGRGRFGELVEGMNVGRGLLGCRIDGRGLFSTDAPRSMDGRICFGRNWTNGDTMMGAAMGLKFSDENRAVK